MTSIVEPTLPMTSLITHPTSPFTLISSHFDSSILFWSLNNIPDVALAQLKFLLGSPENSIFCNPAEAFTNKDHSAKLSGKQSKKLYEKKQSEIEQQEQILRHFNGQDGQEEFWQMFRFQNGQGPSATQDDLRVNHIQDITFAYQSKARELMQISGMKMLGTSLSKKEDRLAEASNLMLKSGNF